MLLWFNQLGAELRTYDILNDADYQVVTLTICVSVCCNLLSFSLLVSTWFSVVY